MKISAERYFPKVGSLIFAPFEPFVSYEHWHRYCYALPFVTGKTVLDIASGEGYGSAFLAAHAALVYGVDISEDAVQHARAAYVRDNLHYLQGAADAIPIPGEHSFDVIVSFETIEHLDATTQERFAAEVTRLLKPEGVLLLSTPNRATYSVEGEPGNPYHLREFTRDEFVAFLRQHFAHVRLLSQHVYPVSYIWNADSPRQGPLVEYQMSLEDGRFRPGEGDRKEIGYLIAVCSQQGEQATGSDSMLLDLSEIAFRGLPHPARWQTSALFSDTGAGFRAEEVVREEVEYGPGFVLEFTLDPATPVRQLRWDPLEMRLCRVRLRQVIWRDGEGLISRLDLGQVSSNGLQEDDGTFRFETLDPMIFLPVSGPVASVTIDGECISSDESSTLSGLEQAVRSRSQQLAQRDQELQALRQQLAERERSVEAQRQEIGRRDHDLAAARQQVAEQEQSIAAYQHQLDRQDHDLAAARRQIAMHEQSVATLTEQLHDRERTIADHEQAVEDRERRIQALERRREELEAGLREVFQSKRWIAINRVRLVVYFLPKLLRAARRRIQDGRRQGDRQPAALPTRPRAIPGRSPVPHTRSGQETPTP